MNKLQNLSYNNLLHLFQQIKPKSISIHNNYFVIVLKKSPYHITVFKDQWDEYHSPTYPLARLFHITNEVTKCSIYFVVVLKDSDNLIIKLVPESDFKYNQSTFSHFASTRSKCDDIKTIMKIIKYFKKIINLLK
jgi:hypothetical protein